jgi:hypothetical protein
MTSTTWRGVPLLESGDGILEGLALLANSLNVGIPVASVAAARTLLTQAEADGVAPTSSNPALFMIGEGTKRILYISDGSKADGVWVLSPVNEVDYDEVGSSSFVNTGQTVTVGSGKQYAIATASHLGVKPYPRLVLAWGMAAGEVTVGSGNLVVLINNSDGQLGRWESDAGQSTVSSMNMGVVAAGNDPQVILGVRGGTEAKNTIKISSNAAANKLMAVAFPITII